MATALGTFRTLNTCAVCLSPRRSAFFLPPPSRSRQPPQRQPCPPKPSPKHQPRLLATHANGKRQTRTSNQSNEPIAAPRRTTTTTTTTTTTPKTPLRLISRTKQRRRRAKEEKEQQEAGGRKAPPPGATRGYHFYDKTKAVACRTICPMPMFFMKNLI